MAPSDLEAAVRDDDLIDFSSYVIINNLSDEDFLLSDSGISGRYGVWPEGMPLNTIDAHQAEQIQLKDPDIYGGSEGWVEYEVPTGGATETFRLEISCPQAPFSKNYLKAQTSNPKVINLTVHPYDASGHPLYGQVDIQVAAAKSTSKRQQRLVFGDSSGDVANGKYPRGNKSLKATYDIGFEGVINKPPVHETIAIAAFILSKKPMPKGTNYHNLNDKQWEYVRGLVWNDDPLCYLFDDYSKNNHDFSNGIAWYDCYRNGPPSCMIRRSHYGDLQFLHAMGSSLDEEPAETLRKLLTWFEVLYKLACGNQGVSDTDKLKQNLGEWFNSKTSPTDEATLRELILASTPNYNQTNIQRRALGICLHMIADSYAVGHTQRRLKNPDSYLGRNSAGYMVFKAGMWGDWGAVLNFHCYDGQNSDHHSFYDGLEGASLPVPKDLDSFNSVIGGRNAIDASKQIINFWAEATKWEDGVETYLKMQVFAIDPKATPSNSQVDESGPISWSCRHFACGRRNPGYRTDMERKLASLDAHVSITDRSGFADKWRCLRWRAALFTLSIFILAVILTFVGLRVHMSI